MRYTEAPDPCAALMKFSDVELQLLRMMRCDDEVIPKVLMLERIDRDREQQRGNNWELVLTILRDKVEALPDETFGHLLANFV